MKLVKIAGKTPTTVKAGAWRKLAGYDPLDNDRFDYDGTVERIAMVYGVTVEEVEDAVNIEDVLPLYLECVRYLDDKAFSKLGNLPKNAKGGQE